MQIKRKAASSDPSFIHWWPQPIEEIWLYQFCKKHSISETVFGSVFGPKTDVNKKFSKKRHVFFSCENLEDRFKEYGNHMLHEWDKGIGFEFRDDKNYMRFPLWLMYYVDPKAQNPGKDFEAKMNKPASQKKDFAAMVASHDERGNGAGHRTLCFNLLSSVNHVLSAGKLLNNTDALKQDFNDDANAFIGSCRFNIALENSNARGYCTEKVFRAFLSGTIPIYWGDCQQPEPQVINQNALLLFDPENPGQLLNQIEELEQDESKRIEFANQRRTSAGAEDFVNNKLEELTHFLSH